MTRIRRVLGFLIYLPNIMPFSALFSAEIFPWAFLYALRKDTRFTLNYGIMFGKYIRKPRTRLILDIIQMFL